MVNPLNLYATKVFAEHPTTMWALDEEVGYLTLFDVGGNEQLVEEGLDWTISGATTITEEQFEQSVPTPPISTTFKNFLQEEVGNGGLISIRSKHSAYGSSISTSLGSFAIGLYLYTPNRSVQVRVGYTYTNTADGQEYEVLRPVNVPTSSRGLWAFVSATFSLPENFSNISPFIEMFYQPSEEVVYQFAINGISFGQWSEEFHSQSLGSKPEAPVLLPNYPEFLGISANPYGLQGKSGYYVVDDSDGLQLCAKNTGTPIVYGSENSTRITPNAGGKPSLVLPGEGFMNKSGQNKSLTFEFWANIMSSATEARRVFGPLLSDDGLYVDRHMIKLKAGSYSGSYSVGEWGRPMLISIRMSATRISVLINGQEVMSIDINGDPIAFPDADTDWVGFYAYDDVPVVQIESPAVYSYEVPVIVQKRRFIYGQGVDFPTSIGGLNHTSIAAIDYSVANYAKNARYPSTSSWSSGFAENMNVGKNSIALPDYRLPKLFLSEKSLEWKSVTDLSFDPENPTFSIKPDITFDNTGGYFFFNSLSFLKESAQSIYAVFEKTDTFTYSGKETLMRFENQFDKSAIDISLDNDTIEYSVEYLDENNNLFSEMFYTCSGVSVGDQFAVGLSFQQAAIAFGGRVASFIGTIQSSKVFIAGNQSYQNTFSGKIHRVAISSAINLQKMINVFDTNGLAKDYSSGSLAGESNKLSQKATYTLVPTKNLGKFELDIATDSYWEDYIPLSYFGKYVLDQANDKFFSLDFLQFNVDYVRLSNFSEGAYDTSSMPVKTYVTFQYLKNGANNNIAYYQNTEPLPKDGIVSPGTDWVTTKYEVLNDSVIKLPVGISIDSLALVIHIEVQSDGILNDNIRIRHLDISSQALGKQPNKIKTQFGSEIVPYKRSGNYFEYKNVSPFSIGKNSSPYLHLTKNSGMKPRVPFSYSGFEGLSIPINKNKASFFKIDLFQMSVRYDELTFPTDPVQLFEIEGPSDYVRFYLVADSNTQKRGQIYAIDSKTGTLRSDIVFYTDGKVVKRPIVNSYSWATLSFSFLDSLSFENTPGAIRITSPIAFDNLSYYQATQLDDVQRFAFRQWTAVRQGQDVSFDWSDWSDVTWQEVLFLAQTDAELTDAQRIYKTFTGTNSFIFDSSSSLVVSNYRSSIYKDLSWSNSTITPV